ncbi:MAG TPA: transposase [Myxococcales bacterium]|jgi:REP element-mobilizing transposase RayT
MRFYRERLPHWRIDGATYFVTWRLDTGQCQMSPTERSIVQTTLLHADRRDFDLLAHVVMDDHVHVVVRPRPGVPLEKVIHSWRSFTTNQLTRKSARRGRVWQGECYDRVIRGDTDLSEKIEYVVSNPWRRWPDTVEYQWVGYLGAEGNGRNEG